MISRRQLLGSAAGGLVLGRLPQVSLPQVDVPAAFTLPAPTGPHAVGTVALHLIDRARTDPWIDRTAPRELMVQLWYPARHAHGRAWPWLTASEAAPVGVDLAQTVGAEPNIIPGLDRVVTSGRHNAPMAGRRAELPVVVFSPGFGAQRNSSSAVVTDLASHGYLVVTVDHTHDATAVEFPGGRIEPNTLIPILEGIEDPGEVTALATRMTEVRAADLRFVLDELGIARAGVFGHSLGGATAARVVHDDPRAVAGINIDGTPYGSAALGKPFMLVAAESTTHESDPAWAAFADGLRGWRREIQVARARHLAFHDTVLLAPALPRITGATPALVAEAYGVIDARRAVKVTRAYVRAFFDLHLRRRHGPLLDGPSRRYPDVTFVPHGTQQTETFSLMGPK
ncbi:alpha/beta fold hydrolase [Actinoplanes sp. ATCC 53533]|uniref:alpha/beta hydrolase family protein n=1 Tax=Actinoplanes sp. ATCC 53533 TaxID=1288362 RepID=UPI0013155587|nr:alpha/beta hydrolase [Actinoplanes sp. ATCC 53533]